MNPSINAPLLKAVNDLVCACFMFSRPDFEINQKLYTEKNEFRIYVYLGGYEYATSSTDEDFVQRTLPFKINLKDPDAVNQCTKALTKIQHASKEIYT